MYLMKYNQTLILFWQSFAQILRFPN